MHTEEAVSLAQVLQNLSTHLDGLCKHATELEETVCEVINQNSDTSGALIYEMQALDRVNQKLQDMAVLTKLLANSTGSETISAVQIEDICEAVNLSTTKALVVVPNPSTYAAEKATPPSSLDLF